MEQRLSSLFRMYDRCFRADLDQTKTLHRLLLNSLFCISVRYDILRQTEIPSWSPFCVTLLKDGQMKPTPLDFRFVLMYFSSDIFYKVISHSLGPGR